MKTVLSVIAAVMKMKQNVSGVRKILIQEDQDHLTRIGTEKEDIKITTMMMTTKKDERE